MRSRKRIVLDFSFLLLHLAKWIAPIILFGKLFISYPALLGPIWFVFILCVFSLIPSFYHDIYRVIKAIIKDTSLDMLESDGEQSYIKGLSKESLSDLKTSFIALIICVSIPVICIIGIINNINLWQEDGANRFGNIALLSVIASGPTILLVQLFTKNLK